MNEYVYRFVITVLWIVLNVTTAITIANCEAKLRKNENQSSLWPWLIDPIGGSVIIGLGYFMPGVQVFWIAGTIMMVLGIIIYYLFRFKALI